MNIFQLAKTYKKLKRLNQIIPILVKYGFGGILSELKLDYYFYLSKNVLKFKKNKDFEQLSNERRFRLALQELGPTFIKLGQVLSIREDILPENWIKELEKLQDKVAPFPFENIKKYISDDFQHIDPIPIASASIAQVHKATLKNNEDVVIKIKRPNIDETVSTDIMLLKQFATLLETYIPEMKFLRPYDLVEEFEEIITKELDFFHELQNIKNFRKIYENDDFIFIPKVYEDLCNEHYMVIEYIEGIKINNLSALKRANYNLKYIANQWSKKVIEQVLIYGFFHADPHPGNIFVLKDGRVAYIDFGMMGRFTEEMKVNIGGLILAIANKDVDKIVKILSNMSDDFHVENLTKFKKNLLDFLDTYYNVSLKNFYIGKILKELLRLLRKYQIKIIVDYVLLDKTMITMEAILKNMDPEFNIFDNAKKLVKDVLNKENNIKTLKKKALKKLQEIKEVTEDIPFSLSDVLKLLKKNRLEIKFHHKGLDDFIREMDRATNRLVLSFIISSTIIASSIFIKSDIGPSVNGISIIGISGFIFAFFLGLWLIYGIIKSGKI
jgi:ubiquinone biosynthesis protein